jgi:hypothetical protein
VPKLKYKSTRVTSQLTDLLSPTCWVFLAVRLHGNVRTPQTRTKGTAKSHSDVRVAGYEDSRVSVARLGSKFRSDVCVFYCALVRLTLARRENGQNSIVFAKDTQ